MSCFHCHDEYPIKAEFIAFFDKDNDFIGKSLINIESSLFIPFFKTLIISVVMDINIYKLGHFISFLRSFLIVGKDVSYFSAN